MYTVYSKSGCQYCEAIEKVFTIKGIPFEKKMLGKDYTKEEFFSMFGRSTFPRILNEDGVLLGGVTETIKLLKESGAL